MSSSISPASQVPVNQSNVHSSTSSILPVSTSTVALQAISSTASADPTKSLNGKSIAHQRQASDDLFHQYLTPAKDGDPVAQNVIGFCYHCGLGGLRNPKEAETWYTMASKQEDIVAHFNLGTLYERYPQEFHDANNRAIKHYQIAADRGFLKAQFNLAIIYEQMQDYDQAIRYYEMAAQQHSHPQAQFNLGVIYETKKENRPLAKYYYEKAAGAEDCLAQYNLGRLYQVDENFRDFSRAVHWFLKAANNGSDRAQYHLGNLYKQGLKDGNGQVIVPQDFSKAMHWFHMAAEQGNTEAGKALFVEDTGLNPLSNFESADSSTFPSQLAEQTEQRGRGTKRKPDSLSSENSHDLQHVELNKELKIRDTRSAYPDTQVALPVGDNKPLDK